MKDSIKRKVVWVTFSTSLDLPARISYEEPKDTYDNFGHKWVKMYSRPQAKFLDCTTPRIDGRNGEPMNITVGEVYDVLAENHQFYTIVNDKGNVARYLKTRFELEA